MVFCNCGASSTTVVAIDGGTAYAKLSHGPHASWSTEVIECEEIPLEHSDPPVYLTGVHSPAVCEGRPCTIHNRTDHAMRSWPQMWNDVTRQMMRISPIGIPYVDPDHFRG